MYAYKVFRQDKGSQDLQPFWVNNEFEPYDPKYIITRANGCGPFTCFDTLGHAKKLQMDWEDRPTVIHKVRVRVSKATKCWITKAKNPYFRTRHGFSWDGTIYIDQFEILERVE